MRPALLVAVSFVIVAHVAAFLLVQDHLPWQWLEEGVESAAVLSVRGTNEFVDVAGDVLWQGFED